MGDSGDRIRRVALVLAIILAVLLPFGCSSSDADTDPASWGKPAPKAPAPTSGPPVRPSYALKGVRQGEVVYQAQDLSIHAMSVRGTDDREVYPPLAYQMQGLRIVGWSPDRRTIGCVIDQSPAPDQQYEGEIDYPLVILDLGTNRITPVTGGTDGLRGGHADYDVDFTPDGRYMLYFSSWDYLLWAADVKSGVTVDVANLECWEDARARLLWPANQKLRKNTVDLHRGRILYWEAHRRLYVAKDGDTSSKKKILPRASQPLFPSLSPDGQFVVLQSLAPSDTEVRGRTFSNPIWSIDLRDMEPRRVATGTAPFIW